MSIADIAKEDFDSEISEVKAFVNSHKDNFPDAFLIPFLVPIILFFVNLQR